MPEQFIFEDAEHFKSIVHNIHGYIYTVLYQNGRAAASYHSPQCYDITGYSPAEYRHNPELWISMVHQDDRDIIYDFFNNRTTKTDSNYIEHRIIHKNGEVRWISNTFSERTNDAGEIIRRDGIIEDITNRKNSELELRRQYDFLQKLIDSIPNPVFYKDTGLRYKGMNKAFEEFMGKTKEEMLGKTIFEITDIDAASRYGNADSELLSTGKPQIYESDFTHPDGSLRRVIFNKVSFTGTNDEPAGILGLMIDKTQMKHLEVRLQQADRRMKELQVIVNKSPAVVFLRRAEPGLPVEFVSENVNIFGYSPDDFGSGKMTFLSLVLHRDIHRFESGIKRFVDEKASEFTQEYRIVSKEGKHIWVDDHTWVRYDQEGRATHYHAVIIDISKRKQAVQLFRESIERYKTLAENSYDLISEISHNARLLYVSPNFTETLGYPADEVLNKSFLTFIHPDDLHPVTEELKKGFGQITHRLRHKNGDWRWFESAGKQYITAEGEKRGVVVSRDITERRKIEQHMLQNEKLVALGEMSGMIAHEFRNSLTSMKMILQLMQSSERLRKQELKSLRIVLDSIMHMEVVLRELLNFTKPSKMTFAMESVNAILDECLQLIRMQAHKQAIQLSKQLDESVPLLYLNAHSFKECIFNLLMNAAQSFDTSVVKIRRRVAVTSSVIELSKELSDKDEPPKNEYFKSGYEENKPNEIVLRAGLKCVLIKIIDNGSGISEEYIPHLFEPFFTSREKGTGLGLPIAKKTINTHGGIIRVRSKAGKGTVFSIILPAEAEK